MKLHEVLLLSTFAASAFAASCSGFVGNGNVPDVTPLYALRQQLCEGDAAFSSCGGFLSSGDFAGSYNITCYVENSTSKKLQAVMWGDGASGQLCWVRTLDQVKLFLGADERFLVGCI